MGKGVQTKIASIGQAIMQAARPRVLLAPLQVRVFKFYRAICICIYGVHLYRAKNTSKMLNCMYNICIMYGYG